MSTLENEKIPSTAPQALWPRYAILAHALPLSRSAAAYYFVADKPTRDWTTEQILQVALKTIREELNR